MSNQCSMLSLYQVKSWIQSCPPLSCKSTSTWQSHNTMFNQVWQLYSIQCKWMQKGHLFKTTQLAEFLVSPLGFKHLEMPLWKSIVLYLWQETQDWNSHDEHGWPRETGWCPWFSPPTLLRQRSHAAACARVIFWSHTLTHTFKMVVKERNLYWNLYYVVS